MKYGLGYTHIEDIKIKGTLSEILLKNQKHYFSVNYTKDNDRVFSMILEYLLMEMYELNQYIQ